MVYDLTQSPGESDGDGAVAVETTADVAAEEGVVMSLEARKALVIELLHEFNESVFDGKIPNDQEVVWNSRLKTTAGTTFFKRSDTGRRTAPIELSVTVVDREARVR